MNSVPELRAWPKPAIRVLETQIKWRINPAQVKRAFWNGLAIGTVLGAAIAAALARIIF